MFATRDSERSSSLRPPTLSPARGLAARENFRHATPRAPSPPPPHPASPLLRHETFRQTAASAPLAHASDVRTSARSTPAVTTWLRCTNLHPVTTHANISSARSVAFRFSTGAPSICCADKPTNGASHHHWRQPSQWRRALPRTNRHLLSTGANLSAGLFRPSIVSCGARGLHEARVMRGCRPPGSARSSHEAGRPCFMLCAKRV